MPVYTFLLKVNTVDVASYGYVVGDLPDNWDAPTQSYDEVAIPGQDGVVETTVEPVLPPRDFKVKGYLITANASAFESAYDTLKLALFSPTLSLIAGNQPTRYRTGRLSAMTSSLEALMNSGRVDFTVHCRNPIAYETSATNPTGSVNTDIACALGTYKSRPVITLSGATNPSITYKNYAGSSVATLSVTGTGTIVIDCSARTVTIGGVRTDSALTGGDFFALNPQDGTYGLSQFPTVRSSSGSVSISYTKAWL